MRGKLPQAPVHEAFCGSGEGYDDDRDREMFRNAALTGKVTNGWVALRSSSGNFLAQKFLERRAQQQ